MTVTETEGNDDNPGVVMKPPKLYLLMLVLGFAFGAVEPLPVANAATRMAEMAAGAVLLAFGLILMALCARRFSGAGTNIPTDRPTTALVTAGPYGWSRNPIYLSLTALYLGIGLCADSGWILLLALPLLVTMRYGVVAREERYLETKFGDAYRDYRTRVRRWM